MTDQAIINIAIQAMIVSAKVGGPILVVSLGIGLGISLIQSVTSIQEVTLTFVPKLVGIAVVIAVAGNWMLQQMVGFTRSLFDQIPSLLAK